MNAIQKIEPVNQIEVSPENVWGMALYSFVSTTEAVCELAKKQPYRDLAVADIARITEATLAINLMHSQLIARRAA
jgi:hypothetical protein